MTRDDARALWTASGLDYSVLTAGNLLRLRTHINAAMEAAGLMQGTLRMNHRLEIYEINKAPTSALLRCRGYYFDDREAVTFNDDGFIGFAGWADDTNVAPVLAGFERWVSDLRASTEGGC